MFVRYRRRILALTTLVFMVWFLAACAIPAQAPATTAGTTTVRVYAAPFLSSAPIYIALAEGDFAEQGLSVDFVPLKSSIDAVPALTQGDIDVVFSSANVALFNTIARGGPIRLVGGMTLIDPKGCTNQGLVVRKELFTNGTLREPSQFRGRHLATGPLGIEGFYVDRYLNRGGLTLADLQVDDISASAIGEALANGSLDAANASEPWLTRILQQGNAELIVGSKDVIPNTQSSVISFGPSFLTEQPEVGKRFLAAVLRGLQRYQEGKTSANVKVVADYTGLEPELIEQICWPTIPADGVLRADTLVPFEQWALSQKAIDRVLSPDEFWDSRFTDAVKQEGTAP